MILSVKNTQLNGFKYSYVTVTIQHQSFVCTHVNGYTYMICKWTVCW